MTGKHGDRCGTALLALGASLAVCSCWSGQSSVVREKAVTDLRCPESSIEVTRVNLRNKDDLGLTDRTAYRVDGCGQHGFYVCEGWDSYQQKSLCEARPSAE